MVVAPQRPLTHSYDPGKDPMEMVDTASGRMERWRANALLVGETSALTEISKQVRDDVAEALTDIEAREAAPLHDLQGKVEPDARGYSLRLKYPVSADQDEDPVGGVEFPDPELPNPPETHPQPIAAGLDNIDEAKEANHGD
jgi:hypothetical protein